jgi:hypothetical protein
MIHLMKVTANLPDELIYEVQSFSGGKNITESINVALTEWLRLAKLKKLNDKLKGEPVEFQSDFSAEKIRELNRKIT